MSAVIDGEMYNIPLSGNDMTGLELKYVSVDPQGDWGLTTFRIERVLNDSTGELFFYALSSFNWTSGEWNSVCQKNGNDTEAILLHGYWDPVSESRIDSPPAVTIACRHYALAKCVEWGYIPWKNATSCDATGHCESVSLQDYHQTCTRMCRADYCGNGTGWTADGTLIDIWDNLTPPIQPRAAPEWPVEAEWNMEGAVCLSGTRLHHWMMEGQPQCSNKPFLRDQTNCGSEVGSRSMLGTSYPKVVAAESENQSTSTSSPSAATLLIAILVPSGALLLFTVLSICFCIRKRNSKSISPISAESSSLKVTSSTENLANV